MDMQFWTSVGGHTYTFKLIEQIKIYFLIIRKVRVLNIYPTYFYSSREKINIESLITLGTVPDIGYEL